MNNAPKLHIMSQMHYDFAILMPQPEDAPTLCLHLCQAKRRFAVLVPSMIHYISSADGQKLSDVQDLLVDTDPKIVLLASGLTWLIHSDYVRPNSTSDPLAPSKKRMMCPLGWPPK